MSVPSSQNDFAAADQPSRSFMQAVRQQQIIHFVLAVGATVFTVVTIGINNGNLNGQQGIVSMVFAGLSSLHFLGHLFVPKFIGTHLLRSISKQELKDMSLEDREMAVVTAVIRPHFVGTAILEGAAFMNLMAYLIEKWAGSLAIAAAFIVLILLRIPSVYGTQNKVNDRLREIEMS